MPPIKILFLGANPEKTGPFLRLDRELRGIEDHLRKADVIERVEIESHMAMRYKDLAPTLLRFKPNIVHISAHGTEQGSIWLEDEVGKRHRVSASVLAEMLRSLRDDIRCVVLNGCWTAKQAEVIAREIDCVVGMQHPISDSAAIRFTAGFYVALVSGKSVQDAFDVGRAEIKAGNLPEETTPQLVTKSGVNAADIVFQSSDIPTPTNQSTEGAKIEGADVAGVIDLRGADFSGSKGVTITGVQINDKERNAPDNDES
jgi:hypothetical protein